MLRGRTRNTGEIEGGEVKTTTNFYCTRGSYNWAKPDEKQYLVSLVTPYGSISETFEDEPEIEGLHPSDVLDIIEGRLKSYWISTDRESKLKTIAEIRKHSIEIDRQYIQSKIGLHELAIERLQASLENLESEGEK